MRLLFLCSLVLLGLVLFLPAATSAPEGGFPGDAGSLIEKMAPDGKIELGFKKDGSFDEVEFHVPWTEIPEDVRTKLDSVLPGGEVEDAEIEYAGGKVHYEVTKKIDGLEAEVLVDASGNVVSWELQVEESKVPEPVRKAAAEATGGDVTAYEEIRDGAKKLTAYHVKKDEGGKKWKIAISPEGAVQYVRREMTAEIEVTVR